MVASHEDGDGLELNSEFAVVAVSIDPSGGELRLRIHDKRTGAVGHLDAAQLEVLVAATQGQMDELLDPGRSSPEEGGASS